VAGRAGQRIYENVSAQAWKMWEERMKMILNEYRLMPWQKEAQELIAPPHGGFLLRARRAALPAGIRPAANQVNVRIVHVQSTAISRSMMKRSFACAARSACLYGQRRRRVREMKSEIALPFRQWRNCRVRLRP
jgi:Fe-S cluster biosynthesis and repair protein YggX